ncbi:hypothetical protein, partial [Bifidobacterium sp. ESL0745]|uniref:hypothetical protein n=1 Tax=Bifidobacterium sp. ESL0745 TaxID=2983226 RepID=UPI0023F678EC
WQSKKALQIKSSTDTLLSSQTTTTPTNNLNSLERSCRVEQQEINIRDNPISRKLKGAKTLRTVAMMRFFRRVTTGVLAPLRVILDPKNQESNRNNLSLRRVSSPTTQNGQLSGFLKRLIVLHTQTNG